MKFELNWLVGFRGEGKLKNNGKHFTSTFKNKLKQFIKNATLRFLEISVRY